MKIYALKLAANLNLMKRKKEWMLILMISNFIININTKKYTINQLSSIISKTREIRNKWRQRRFLILNRRHIKIISQVNIEVEEEGDPIIIKILSRIVMKMNKSKSEEVDSEVGSEVDSEEGLDRDMVKEEEATSEAIEIMDL